MDEWYGNGRLDNRGFVSLATLEISRTDINLLCKPQSKCGALKFEINRDRTHMIWRGDQLPTYEPATPAPTVCSFTKLTESNHTLLGNMLTNGPKQRPKLPGVLSFYIFLNYVCAFRYLHGVSVNIISKRQSTNAQR